MFHHTFHLFCVGYKVSRQITMVNIPPEVKHWHGAAKDSWFQHLAVEVPAEGASNEWLEAVEDEEYSKLP